MSFASKIVNFTTLDLHPPLLNHSHDPMANDMLISISVKIGERTRLETIKKRVAAILAGFF